jgi:DNA-binding response OmpR family regulator
VSSTKNLEEYKETGSSPNEVLRVLLIDDDQKFCRLIGEFLNSYGFEVSAVHSGLDGVSRVAAENWDAVVLDVMLPGIDGYEVLKRLREHSQVPVLMLTALGDETDRIVGLELGADDYLPKTFSPRELLARLRAVLRRSARLANPPEPVINELVFGPLKINLDARQASFAEDPLPLTPVEFDLLVVLAQAKGKVKSREQLLGEIRDRNYDIFDRSVDVHISALRRKLGEDPKHPRFIRTVRAAGYMFAFSAEKV